MFILFDYVIIFQTFSIVVCMSGSTFVDSFLNFFSLFEYCSLIASSANFQGTFYVLRLESMCLEELKFGTWKVESCFKDFQTFEGFFLLINIYSKYLVLWNSGFSCKELSSAANCSASKFLCEYLPNINSSVEFNLVVSMHC